MLDLWKVFSWNFFFLMLGDTDWQVSYPDKIKRDSSLNRSKKINKSSVILLYNLNYDLSMEKQRGKIPSSFLRCLQFFTQGKPLDPTIQCTHLHTKQKHYSAILYCLFFSFLFVLFLLSCLLEFYEASFHFV